MIKEALEFLISHGQEDLPYYFRPHGEPDHVYYLLSSDGNGNSVFQKVEAEPEPRLHKVYGLETIVDLANEYMDTEVWYSRSGVAVFLSKDRRHRAWMPLQYSRAVELLLNMQESLKSYQADDFLRMLRLEMGFSMSGEDLVLSDFPGDLILNVPVWHCEEAKHLCRCLLERGPQSSGTFSLTPYPGEVEKLIRAGEDDIRRVLAGLLDDGEDVPPVPLYYGTP